MSYGGSMKNKIITSGLVVLFVGLLFQVVSAKRSMSDLMTDLKGYDPLARAKAVKELSAQGEKAKEVIPLLVELALKDPALYVRKEAKATIQKLGKNARGAAPLLVKAVRQDEDNEVKQAAIDTLGMMGKNASLAVSDLASLLTHKDPWVKQYAYFGLDKMGKNAKGAVGKLTEVLDSDNPDSRKFACTILGSLEEHAKLALPKMEKLMLHDTESIVRSNCAFGISYMGKHATAAVPSLIKALDDQDANVKRAVIHALGDMGLEAKKALPKLKTFMKDDMRQPSSVEGQEEERELQQLAREAIQKITEKP